MSTPPHPAPLPGNPRMKSPAVKALTAGIVSIHPPRTTSPVSTGAAPGALRQVLPGVRGGEGGIIVHSWTSFLPLWLDVYFKMSIISAIER